MQVDGAAEAGPSQTGLEFGHTDPRASSALCSTIWGFFLFVFTFSLADIKARLTIRRGRLVNIL